MKVDIFDKLCKVNKVFLFCLFFDLTILGSSKLFERYMK